MEDVKTGGVAGRALCALAGVLLLLVWLAGMSLDDDRLCSSVPLCFGFAAVVGLALAGMVAGVRPAKPTPMFFVGLGAGLYFLVRCLSGDMLSEIWRELPLILGCFVFYGAGYMLAQRRGGSVLIWSLALAVAVNVVYFILIRHQLIPIEAKGRPTMSLAGGNTLRNSLFTYRNFTAMFLVVAGGVLVCRPAWVGWKSWGAVFGALVGMGGFVCATFTESRAIAALTVFMLVCAWGLWAIIRLYSAKNVGVGLVLSGFILFVGIGVLLGELFMGNELVQKIAEVDTHGRKQIWDEIMSLLPNVPWYGHGAGATTWQLVPITSTYSLTNYAHNEYLQAWVDYGIVGLLLMLVVLLGHLAAGYWCLASEEVGRERRALVAACMLMLLAFAACSAYDFVWHNVSLAGMTAFACGVLAAPFPDRAESLFSHRKWAPGSRPSLRLVRPMGRCGLSLCCTCCLCLAVGCAWFACRLLPGWVAQWQYNALYHAGASDAQRAAFLEEVMPAYPDPELVDHYVSLRVPTASNAERAAALDRREAMIRMALQSNPHQLFMVVTLVDVLGRKGKYAEAEGLMRDFFLPDGQPSSSFANWPAYYGLNLLYWGRQKMLTGDKGSALSMMEYALRLRKHARDFRHSAPFAGELVGSRYKATAAYVKARRKDIQMLQMIGTVADDSWKQPMRPGGSPALYRRWAEDTEEPASSESKP